MKLSVRHLSAYRGPCPVVGDVSFDADAPGMVGLVGPNGAGKTTLLRAIAGLMEAQGTAHFDGRDLTTLSGRERARTLSYLAQGAEAHWPLTAERVVALGRLPHLGAFAAPGPEDKAAIEKALTRVDAHKLMGRRIDQLSGGERARVLVARALAVEAPLLLVDEPVTALDPFHQLKVMDVLRSYAAEGRLVVVVLHDLTLAARYCDSLVLMQDGGVFAFGEPSDVLSPPNLASVYRVQALFGSHETEQGPGAFVLPWSRIE